MTDNGQAAAVALEEAPADELHCKVQGCKSTEFQEWIQVVSMEHQRMDKNAKGEWVYAPKSVTRKDESSREVLGIKCKRGHLQ